MKYSGLAVFAVVLLPGCDNGWQRSDFDLARGTSGPAGAVPAYGETRSALRAPPPISGGTLLVARDGNTAVAADSDRDRVWITDLQTRTLRGEVALRPGDEPGRVIDGPTGRVFVSLRRGGAIAAIDLATPTTVAARFDACPSPRGLAYEQGSDSLHVACADGQLLTLRGSTGEIVRRLKIDDDLRDVVVTPTGLRVTRFRSAELLSIGNDGSVGARVRPGQAGMTISGGLPSEPNVAWRTLMTPDGKIYIVHQRSRAGEIPVSTGTSSGAYGGGGGSACGSGAVVQAAVSEMSVSGNGEVTAWTDLPSAALPVDVAVSPTSDRMVVAAAGNASVGGMPQLYTIHRAVPEACSRVPPADESRNQPNGQVVAVAFDASGHLLAQTREPAALYLIDANTYVRFPGESRGDTGHEVFHGSSGRGIACASCHPEGGDDGRVWNFSDVGARRSQNLRGGVIGAAPLHWGGELARFGDLVGQTFVDRMGGPQLDASQQRALGGWINTIALPARAAPAVPAAVERGHAIFDDPSVGCANCHSGDRFTNNAVVDVGTHGRFKVPSLNGVAMRGPFMHDGCARSLRARFDAACGGGEAHGHTADLTEPQLNDLTAYLETL